ncbi:MULTISPECIES: DEAD/DEAH box helicase [unclassified Paraflavitalea]|uniref:DEAD/DEAH box helicase n=1 Tax=unclassified Paraflavitalea TaxID=2798305 RepID=UPI003D3425E9
MSEAIQKKTALVFHPNKLSEDQTIFELLFISKKGNIPSFEKDHLSEPIIDHSFPKLPDELRKLLKQATQKQLNRRNDAIKMSYKIGSGKQDFDSYKKQQILKAWHEFFLKLKPYFTSFNWYHYIWTAQKNAVLQACTLSDARPELQFEWELKQEGPSLHTLVSLNGVTAPLSDFSVQEFFLCKDKTYYILTLKDALYLQKLSKAGAIVSWEDELLQELQEHYTIRKTGIEATQKEILLPVNRMMLQEISNSFLLLTPQWLYDGFVVERDSPDPVEFLDRGQPVQIKRNKELEQAFIELIEGLHPNFAKQMNGRYYLSFADAQKKGWFLKTWTFLLEQQIEIVGMDLLKHFRYASELPVTQMDLVREDAGSLTYKMSIRFGKETVGLAALQKMLWAGQHAVVLNNGSFGALPIEWLAYYGPIIKHGKVQKDELTIARWMGIAHQPDNKEGINLSLSFNQDWWQKWKQWQTSNESLFNINPLLNATLRPYQQKGSDWMLLLEEAGAGACLADDMGLGKTLQTISALCHIIHRNPGSKHLIIAPMGLMYNWMQELKKFAPEIAFDLYYGSNRSATALEQSEASIFITSYGTLRTDAQQLASVGFHTVVVDESHQVKNPTALVTRALMQVPCKFRIALSGTPILNNTFDLYSQLEFLLPGLFGNREFFKREYADPIDRWQDTEKIQALKLLTAPFILRRTKEQVAKDLPDKTESVIWCEMESAQRIVYEEIRSSVEADIWSDIKTKGMNQAKMSILAGLTKLRQICNSPALLKDEENSVSDSIKTDLLIEELTQLKGKSKSLVFSQYTSMLDLLEPALEKAELKFYRIDGTVSGAKRQEIVNQFQAEDDATGILLISLKAGNAGLNLTAAEYVFLFDPWWNTAVEQQAIDRTHRIGQTKKVFAYKMICKDSIEEKILQLQGKKQKLSEDLIGEENGFVKNLSEEEIRFLFSR